ncbi:hypothetical protein GH714_008950 [Hevea brasiliensis]|uniref:Uncharacterized protein n=1 Tax=Hevea brasiliensis TaxID=3981 RepID=A0A6A6N130_HEVBR|nr:hypothetical protein GH714_008950 [Hevea brasiliensis]
MGGGACRFCLSLMSLSSIFVGILANPIENLRCFLELPDDRERIKLLAVHGGDEDLEDEFEKILFFFIDPAELTVSENSPYREDFDDAEETLSLSDLPLNSNSSVDLDDFSKEYQSSTFDHQDFFEFFSEDSSASITYHKDNNIIFCGKLIPPKEPTVAHHERAKNPEIFIPKSKKKGIFPWKSRSFSMPSISTSSKQIQKKILQDLQIFPST